MVTYVKPLQEVPQSLAFLSLAGLLLLHLLRSFLVQKQYLFQRFLRRVVIRETGIRYRLFDVVASNLYCSFQNLLHALQVLPYPMLVSVTRLSVVK